MALTPTSFGKGTLYVYYTGRDGINRLAFYNPQAKKWMYANRGLKNWQFMPEGYTTHDGYNFKGDYAAVVNQKNAQGVLINYASSLPTLKTEDPLDRYTATPALQQSRSAYNRAVATGMRNPYEDAVPVWWRQEFVADLVEEPLTPLESVPVVDSPNLGKKTVVRRPAKTNWDKQYQDFLGRMTDDLKAWLAHRGIDYSSAQKMLEYLTRVGKDVGKFGADNKWGDDSQRAWDDLVNTTMKNNPLLTPVKDVPKKVEPVVDAPDPFGYKTSNTYENGDFASKLKKMGIRSNADLINFMYKTKDGWSGDEWLTQFRSDVDRALGGDYSDANIQKVFGTKGNWGRGFLGRGDFGDFQNALQTNAGVWNSRYDTKLSNARMDAARQLYAVKQAQQFTPQLSKPTIEDPSKKFMVGKTQTNTLGNVGAGSLGDDWMKFALQTGYLPTE